MIVSNMINKKTDIYPNFNAQRQAIHWVIYTKSVNTMALSKHCSVVSERTDAPEESYPLAFPFISMEVGQ